MSNEIKNTKPQAADAPTSEQRCERFKKYSRFSDFNPNAARFIGEKKLMKDVIGKEILILDYRVMKGKYNTDQCTQIQFEMSEFEGKKFVLFTGSTVLKGQLEEAKEQMPFCATIQRVDKYFTFC